MKIEMINEHQIRCTLTREDLEDREIKLSELAYGSEKAKLLFRDMMQQAAEDFGFEAEDIPLMIEAIPLSSESIMLIISKVDSPDELDTRFSNFTQDISKGKSENMAPKETPHADLSGLIAQIHNGKRPSSVRKTDASAKQAAAKVSTTVFSFTDTDHAILLAHHIGNSYAEHNSLFFDDENSRYYLILHQGKLSAVNFNKISHTASKYLHQEPWSPEREAFFKEHFRTVLPHDALANLAKI